MIKINKETIYLQAIILILFGVMFLVFTRAYNMDKSIEISKNKLSIIDSLKQECKLKDSLETEVTNISCENVYINNCDSINDSYKKELKECINNNNHLMNKKFLWVQIIT